MHRFNPDHHARLDDAERYDWQDPQRLIEWLDLAGAEAIVDFGSGTGFMALPLAERLPDGTVTGFDISPKMRAILNTKAADRGLDNVCGLLTDGVSIQRPDATADIVLLANVWHEVADVAALAKECRRILKPGGRLVVIDWKAQATPVGPPVAERVSLDEAAASLETHGFRLTDEPTLYPYHYVALFTQR